MIDGDRLERARSLARAVRGVGFQTPLWGPADSHRISDLNNFDFLGEVTGYIYLGQQTPTFYAKAGYRQPHRVRNGAVTAILRRVDGL